jgi:hypothetical protein
MTMKYNGFLIEKDTYEFGYKEYTRFFFWPEDQERYDEYDLVGEDWKYCGNAKWADSWQDAMNQIDEIVETK